MNIFMIILIAVGLAMDAFAVSIALGMMKHRSRLKTALLAGGSFGTFQAFMPILGWFLGSAFRGIIFSVDHWVAFGLLLIIGGKMIIDSTRKKKIENEFAKMSIYLILILSIATSIDALAMGITFAFLEMPILFPILMIGVITFILSFVGVYIGIKLNKIFRLQNKVQIIGGLILIIIGIRILIDHLSV